MTEGVGGGGSSGGDPGGGGFGGGPDIGAILAYLNHQSFGSDGDYTGNAGYGGDNTGPVGSAIPWVLEDSGTWADADLLTPEAPRSRGPERDPYTGGWESDPFLPDSRMPDRGATSYAALRPPRLLASPILLAENDVIDCNPTRTSCRPPVRSDANQSSVANELQAELDESYFAIQALSQGKAHIVGDRAVDVQKLAAAAAEQASSDRHQLDYQLNLLRDHPLEIKHSSVLTGLGHMAWGAAIATGSGLIVYGSGGLALPLVGATGLSAGIAEVASGLSLAVSGADSAETMRMSGQLDYVFALTASPASLAFGTTGLVLSGGDQRVSHGFALVGGVAEGLSSFRGDPSKLYSAIVPGLETRGERAASALLIKDVTALGYTARGESVATAAAKLNREFTVSDLQGIAAFREDMARTGRLDLAGLAGHDAAGAAPRGVDFSKYGGAFQQELKFHGPYTPLYSAPLDKAWNQSLQYSIKYQLETRAFGEQLIPIRSVKHIWVSPTEAVRYLR